jgi:hypothetical protein
MEAKARDSIGALAFGGGEDILVLAGNRDYDDAGPANPFLGGHKGAHRCGRSTWGRTEYR